MYNINLSFEEMDVLRNIILYEIESDEFDTPDFADVNLMEKFSHRAKVLQKVIQLMSCTTKEEIGK